MKTAFALTFSLSLLGSVSQAGETTQNEHVRVEVSLSKPSAMPGDKLELAVRFKPADGIHITSDPPLAIHVTPSNMVQLLGKWSQIVDSTTGYLATEEPVKQPMRIPSTTTPGQHLLTATITYYFCSDEAGWCRKFVETLQLPLTVQASQTKPARKPK